MSTIVEFPPVPEIAGDPYSRGDVVSELRRIHDESVRYWSAYDTPSFFRRPQPDVWAPADQVRHLSKSINAVNGGLRMPRVALRLMFGKPAWQSRRLPALIAEYRAALGRGRGAGRFAPRPLEPTEQDDVGRRRVMSIHAQAVDSIGREVERWPDRALDGLSLPHPLLGKLTVREMLLFTLLHNVHHVRVAERRRRELMA